MNGSVYNAKNSPELLSGLVLGSIIGIVFFKGVPVGPYGCRISSHVYENI